MDHVPGALTRRRRVWLWGPAVLQMAVIFALSGTPNLGALPVKDVTAHFAGYALLAALVARATSAARWSGMTLNTAGRAWLISAVYGVTDEFHQSFVAGRTPERE